MYPPRAVLELSWVSQKPREGQRDRQDLLLDPLEQRTCSKTA